MTEFVRKSGPEASNNDGPPLTRRELRAREQAALEAAPAPSVSQQPPAQQPPAPQAAATPPAFLSFQAGNVASTDLPSRRSLQAPKKPSSLRPVRLPRGISRPRALLSVPSRPSGSPSQRRPLKRRMLKKLMTLGAMVGAGLMMVSTTIPANAFYSVSEQASAVAALEPAPAEAEVQSISVQPTADLTLARDGYTATSFREQIFLRYGNRNFSFTNNPNGTIQWPFPIAVPISDGYGYRIDPCSFCSPWHKGVDFTPGVGSNIQAIADGVVTKAEPAHWGFGNHVIIEHVINGKRVQSVYAHMLDGSIRVEAGQAVKVGDTVGQVGSTGESTGPHLHFEVHVGGEPIDPFEWLKANAN